MSKRKQIVEVAKIGLIRKDRKKGRHRASIKNRHIATKKLNTEEIQELLPEFSRTSALSLLEAKEAWKRILVKTGVHRDLWGSIVLSKLKGEALLSLQPSVKHDYMFEEICESFPTLSRILMRSTGNL